jgi:hypothetical protein
MSGACSTYKILVGKPEEERQLGKPRRRWEPNIVIDLEAMVCENVDWTHPTQDRAGGQLLGVRYLVSERRRANR